MDTLDEQTALNNIYDEKMKNLVKFLDDHPNRCRYQYNKRDYGKGWLHKFCGWPTVSGSKFCNGCQRRKNTELILPSYNQCDWYIN